ncbi:MAG TPA: lantibiotic dehydratase, partial [Candidatus Xenobia bacterium]
MTGFDVELAPWAVLRVAAWSPDVLEPLRAPELTVPAAPRPPQALLEALHAVVPRASREDRRVLLEAGRRLFGSPDPLPPKCLEAVRQWLPEVDDEQQAREALPAFTRAHEAALDRARRYLQRLPEDFLKALAVARPDIDPARRSRKTETTLYHYLCRAAGRPTPNALWAGCTLLGAGQAGETRC